MPSGFRLGAFVFVRFVPVRLVLVRFVLVGKLPLQSSSPVSSRIDAPKPVAAPRRLVRGARRAGFTLLECIGFLTVATIIIAGTIGVYEQAQTAVRTNQFIIAVGLLSISARALHANIGSYGGTDSSSDSMTELLVNANLVQQGLAIDTATGAVNLSTLLGGGVELYADGSEQGRYFWIEAGGIADDVCINILTKSISAGFNGLQFLMIYNTDVYDPASLNISGIAETTPVSGSSSGGRRTGTTADVYVRGKATVSGGRTSGFGGFSYSTYPISPRQADDSCVGDSDGTGVGNSILWVYD